MATALAASQPWSREMASELMSDMMNGRTCTEPQGERERERSETWSVAFSLWGEE